MKKLVLLSLIAGMFSSCSVVMAAKKEGTPIETIQNCNTRGQVLAAGAMPVSAERTMDGDLIEVYTVKKEKGSTARAVMHGTLDVCTTGLWEVVGTPMEGYMSKNEFYSIKVIYDCNDVIKHIELL